MFNSLFGAPTAAGESGARLRALCKAAAARDEAEAAALESRLTACSAVVGARVDTINDAIDTQQKILLDAQRQYAKLSQHQQQQSGAGASASASSSAASRPAASISSPEFDFLNEAKARLARLRAHRRVWASELRSLQIEKYLPGGDRRWLLRTQAEEGVYLGLRDLRLDNFGARFDVRAGAGWLMIELSEGQVGISIEHFALRGSSASVRFLSAFLSPEAVEFSLKINKLVLPCVWQKVPDVEWIDGTPTHRWRVDEENMCIELSFEKSIKGGASAPDALIEWIAKKLFPEIMRQVTQVLPDELGEFLNMGSLHWLCAGQLSLQTTVARAVWAAPLAAAGPDSRQARELLSGAGVGGADGLHCHATMFVLNDWCERSGAGGPDVLAAPVSLRSLYAFGMRFAIRGNGSGGSGSGSGKASGSHHEGDGDASEVDWAAIVALLQDTVALWETEIRRGTSDADRAAAAKLAAIRNQSSSSSSSSSAGASGVHAHGAALRPEFAVSQTSASSFSSISPPLNPPAPVIPAASTTGFFGALCLACCSSGEAETDSVFDNSRTSAVAMASSPSPTAAASSSAYASTSAPPRATAASARASTVAAGAASKAGKGAVSSSSSSSSSPSTSTAGAASSLSSTASDWLVRVLRRAAEIGRQHMRVTLRLTRFDLQLDLSALLDLGAKLLHRIQALQHTAAKTAAAARAEGGAASPSAASSASASGGGGATPSSPSAAAAAASTAATEQLLSNLPQFVRGVLQQIDHAHSSFSLELLGAADCHLDCTFDDVSLQARAPVAHFLLDPTESSVSAAMPGMEVDFRYTPEDLLQMSWHVAERADVPRVYRLASAQQQNNFPSQVSLSFLVGGVQLLMLPCKLRRRIDVASSSLASSAPASSRTGSIVNAGVGSGSGTGSKQRSGSGPDREGKQPLDAASNLLRQMPKGAIAMSIARAGVALPVWPSIAQVPRLALQFDC